MEQDFGVLTFTRDGNASVFPGNYPIQVLAFLLGVWTQHLGVKLELFLQLVSEPVQLVGIPARQEIIYMDHHLDPKLDMHE